MEHRDPKDLTRYPLEPIRFAGRSRALTGIECAPRAAAAQAELDRLTGRAQHPTVLRLERMRELLADPDRVVLDPLHYFEREVNGALVEMDWQDAQDRRDHCRVCFCGAASVATFELVDDHENADEDIRELISAKVSALGIRVLTDGEFDVLAVLATLPTDLFGMRELLGYLPGDRSELWLRSRLAGLRDRLTRVGVAPAVHVNRDGVRLFERIPEATITITVKADPRPFVRAVKAAEARLSDIDNPLSVPS